MSMSTGEINNNYNTNSGSTSRPSSIYPSSPSCPVPETTKSMEDVWKDISLSCLHHPITTTTSTTNSFLHNMTFQDFLSQPSKKNPPTKPDSSSAGTAATFLESPATILSLNTESAFHYPQITDSLKSHSQLGTVRKPSSLLPYFCKKISQKNDQNYGDCQHKRMIKNRESAARSRARKQAYIIKLEHEIDRLTKENAKLRGQQEKLWSAAPALLQEQQTLHRTLTAPF